jgi:hypothetical protein
MDAAKPPLQNHHRSALSNVEATDYIAFISPRKFFLEKQPKNRMSSPQNLQKTANPHITSQI